MGVKPNWPTLQSSNCELSQKERTCFDKSRKGLLQFLIPDKNGF